MTEHQETNGRLFQKNQTLLFLKDGVLELSKKKDLFKPINRLEKYQDKKRIWRGRVNEELKKNYTNIFKLINTLIFLKVPSFNHVYKWRLLQEEKLKITSKGKKTMNKMKLKIL